MNARSYIIAQLFLFVNPYGIRIGNIQKSLRTWRRNGDKSLYFYKILPFSQ